MTKKILVNLWEPLNYGLKKKMDAVCMKRDLYLDLVLRHEARMIDEEVPGRNSDDAKNHIAEQLGLLQKQQVNLLLREETTELIADVCNRKNTPRDALINRVILLLIAPLPFLKRILWEIDWELARELLLDSSPEEIRVLIKPNTLDTIAGIIQDDPFQYLRACIGILQEEQDNSIPPLHRMLIQKDAFAPNVKSALGFNCFIEDAEIEGHPAKKAREEESHRLLDELFLGKEANLK